MTYQVVIRRQAKRKLQSLPRGERNRIAEKITLLGDDPDNPQLDIKSLQGEQSAERPLLRLRVGRWRVIFDRQDSIRVISVERIKPRGDAYK